MLQRLDFVSALIPLKGALKIAHPQGGTIKSAVHRARGQNEGFKENNEIKANTNNKRNGSA